MLRWCWKLRAPPFTVIELHNSLHMKCAKKRAFRLLSKTAYSTKERKAVIVHTSFKNMTFFTKKSPQTLIMLIGLLLYAVAGNYQLFER